MGMCVMCSKKEGMPEYCQECVERYGFVNNQEKWDEIQREKYNQESNSPSNEGLLDNVHPDDYLKVLMAQNDVIIQLLSQQTIHQGGVIGGIFSNISGNIYKDKIEKIKRDRKYGNN